MRPLFLLLGLLVCLLLSLPAGAAPRSSKDAVQVQSPLDSKGCGTQETSLGNLIADMVRDAGHADVALVAADELNETSISAGDVPASQFVSALRYGDDATDTIVVLNLTGAQLLRAAERSVSRAPQTFGGFLQVSGLQVRYDPSQPEGKRVSLAGAGGSEISAGKTYRVATTHPIAFGNLGYFQVWSKKDIAEDTQQPLGRALVAYLTAHKVVNTVVEGRISAAH